MCIAAWLNRSLLLDDFICGNGFNEMKNYEKYILSFTTAPLCDFILIKL